MKKISTLIISLILAIICIAPITSFAGTSEQAVITAGNVQCRAGDTVKIPVEIKNNPGITSFRIVVEYDSVILKLTNVELKEASQGFYTGTSEVYDSPYSISGYNAKEDIDADGQLVLLTFEIKSDAQDGRYDITLSYDADDIFNMAGESVDFKINDGFVEVIPCSHTGGEWEYVKRETCTEDGIMVKKCAVCGAEYESKKVNAKGHTWDSGVVTTQPTCTATGVKTYTCTVCGETKTETIAKTSHNYKNVVTKATLSKNGKIATVCTLCGETKDEKIIYSPKTFALSATTYTYDGKAKKPTVTVKDANGNVIDSSNYTVAYSGNCINAGEYDVTITFKGNYEGTKVLSFEIKGVDQWLKSGKRWWYRHADGSYTKNDWEKIDGKWYFFDEDGWMQTGWLKDGGKWYYLNSSGVMTTGWEKIGGKWYYMNSSGVMQTGWEKIGGKWYYFNSSGVMQTGWLKLGGKWYYMNSSGVMLTGRQKIGNKWYTFNSSGVWVK